jgi:hypothetical protein
MEYMEHIEHVPPQGDSNRCLGRDCRYRFRLNGCLSGVGYQVAGLIGKISSIALFELPPFLSQICAKMRAYN